MPESTCDYCQLVNSKMKIFENENIAVVLSPKPAFHGHTLILPKKHYNIIEQIPDNVVGEMFSLANHVSKSLFETLNIHGTNIIIQNGIAAGQDSGHFSIHVIPRREGDGIDFQWKTKQLEEEEMSTVELTIKGAISDVGIFESSSKEPIKLVKKVEQIVDSDENYLIKQMRRIP